MLRRLLPTALMLALAISLPTATAFATSTNDDGETYRVEEPANPTPTPAVPSPSPAPSPPIPAPPTPPSGNTNQPPHFDLRDQPDQPPIIERDTNKDVGTQLRNGWLSPDDLHRGMSASRVLTVGLSTIVGWLITILVAYRAFDVTIGLFYIGVPIGFIRNVISGGRYSNGVTGTMTNPHSSRQAEGADGGFLRHFNIIPSAAFVAVQMAEGGAVASSTHAPAANISGGAMGTMGRRPMGPTSPASPVSSPAPSDFNPWVYYFRQQAVGTFFLAIAIVALVLSPVFFDSGLIFGNTFVQLIYWVINFLFGGFGY